MQARQNRITVKKDETSIVEVLGKYLAYWPLFLIFLVLSFTGAFMYLRYTIPVYQSVASIVINDEKKGNDDAKGVQSIDVISSKKIIENEIEVLQSRNLMLAVVEKLHLYAPVFQEGKVKTVPGYLYSPVTIQSAAPDSLQQVEKVLLQYNEQTGIVTLNNSYKGAIGQWLKTPYGTLKFDKNEKYIRSTLDKPFYFSLVSPQRVAAGMMSALSVEPSSKTSSVITLLFMDEIPQRGEDVLDELILAYSNASLKEKNNLAKNTLAFIEARLSVVSKDLDSIERKLQQYKAGRGAVDIGRQGQLYLENIAVNDRKLSDLNLQVSVMDQLEKAAASPGNAGMIPSTLGVNDQSLIQQMNNLNSLQAQYDKLKLTVAENNPMLLSLTEQIDRARPSILKNIQSQRKSLEQSRGSLYATGGGYSSILSNIPQKEKELVEISRDQNIKNGIYSFLLQKREETELALSSTYADSKVINYAQSSKAPVSPKRMIIFLIATVVAIGLPILFIVGREVLSPKILYRSEIEHLTKIPIIGEISFNKSKDLLKVESGKRTIIAEEFRKVRISLLSLGVNAEHKKILLTSSISGEGKSFIAANLASSISLTGKKVVLVDMDLHNPGLGKFFSIKETAGVSDFLLGRKTVEEIIFNIPGNENLFYISSGNLQDDSSELLENGKVQHLISRLDENFDMVIIDTAPVVLITDAHLISSLCDATLYIVRHKITPKMLIKRMDSNFEINPIKNAAIIFNGVKTRGFFKNNYGYGYNNYVYGYNNKKKKKSSFI